MLLRILFLTTLINLCACQPSTAPISPDLPNVVAGTLKRLEAFPSDYVSPRNVEIWLPPGYDVDTRYPVLYMHDGQMLYDSTKTWNKQEWGVDEVISQLMEQENFPAVIVVGIWNGGADRHPDYFPQKPFESLPKAFRDSLLANGAREGGTPLFHTSVQSDAYLKFMVDELKPHIDQHYATLSDRAHTYVMGSSMGGLISMYALCEYPEVFAGAACLSTHWPGIFTVENNPIPEAFAVYLEQNLPDPASHVIYFDHGTETLDALYPPLQQKIDSILMKQYPQDNWASFKIEGADHSERAWNARLDIPLRFLFGSEGKKKSLD